jgi:menaquinone-dependent protoporphyrinogen oxidase
MRHIVFIYSTVDGHTLEICERLAKVVEDGGFVADLVRLTPGSTIDLEAFDQVVIGASIRYGKHRPEVEQFIRDNIEAIEARHGAFFSVNAVARKADKNDALTNPYVRKFFQNSVWKPSIIGIFGGKIDYSMYRFWDRTMIRFIMWMTKGPTDLNTKVDFTDWDEVEAFGKALCTIRPNLNSNIEA